MEMATGEKIRLLVRADDAGSSWSSNMGCLKACADGIVRSVEVMMPCAWVSHAARLFNDRPEIDVGIHLTLTSEWDAVRWRPLTDARSLVDEDGYFRPLLMPRPGDDRPSLRESDWSVDDIARELRAQIERGVAAFDNASHVSAHMAPHFSAFDQRVGEIVAELCREFQLIDVPPGHGLARFEGYPKHPRSAERREAAFIEQLGTLKAGTYMFVDHPAVESAELRATGHKGYEDVLEDRTTCLSVLVSEGVKAAVSSNGIELIGYRDL